MCLRDSHLNFVSERCEITISDKRLSRGTSGWFFSGIDLVKSTLSRADLAKHEAARRKEKKKKERSPTRDTQRTVGAIDRESVTCLRDARGGNCIRGRGNIRAAKRAI